MARNSNAELFERKICLHSDIEHYFWELIKIDIPCESSTGMASRQFT